MTGSVDISGLARDFGCPMHIASAMATDAGPLLMAVLRIGPSRVQWADGKAPFGGIGESKSTTAWFMDGQRATAGQIYNAVKQGEVMPNDETAALTADQLSTVKSMKDAFGNATFSALGAGALLNLPKASAAAILCNLVAKGALYRESVGYFTFVKPRAEDRELSERDARVIRESARDPVLPVISFGDPITSVERAIGWLTAFRISVEPQGSIFLVDNRFRLSEEQLIASAERRRTHRDRYPPQKPRTVRHLPTQMVAPTADQMMRGR